MRGGEEETFPLNMSMYTFSLYNVHDYYMEQTTPTTYFSQLASDLSSYRISVPSCSHCFLVKVELRRRELFSLIYFLVIRKKHFKCLCISLLP